MKTLISLVAVVFLSACAQMAPLYRPSIPNVQALNAVKPIRLGQFTAANDSVESLQVRANVLKSSVDGKYESYIRDALGQELSLANKLDANAAHELSCQLLDQNLDAGLDKGKGTIQAEFVLKNGGVETYRKRISAEQLWESSFAGMIAIPAAEQNYPFLVQNLLAGLYADKDFINAAQ